MSPEQIPSPVAFVGSSGSGKTTVILAMIERFLRSGRNSGVIKHTHHELRELDRGDSAAFLRAGAEAVILANDQRGVKIRPTGVEWLADISPAILPKSLGTEIVLVEGFKQLTLWPKIAVLGPGERSFPADCVALVTSEAGLGTLPAFDREDLDGLFRFVGRIVGSQ